MKFEYKLVAAATPNDLKNLEQTLNELGEEGWELVTGAFATFILKREKK